MNQHTSRISHCTAPKKKLRESRAETRNNEKNKNKKTEGERKGGEVCVCPGSFEARGRDGSKKQKVVDQNYTISHKRGLVHRWSGRGVKMKAVGNRKKTSRTHLL